MQLFKCEICDRSFHKAANLATHKNVHNENFIPNSTQKRLERERSYQQCPELCAQCSKPIPYKKLKTKRAEKKKALQRGNLNYKTFCNSSCAATYNNTHKTHGTRKSKLECYLETKLKELYPTLEFHFNKKDAIDSELDIYVPLLKLAFELNGIYHYEPIHGAKKLTEIQNNDHRKFQACLERNIELCIIDSSKLSYFKESNAKPYLEIVQKIIDQKIKAEGIILEDFPVVVYSNQRVEKARQCLHCKKQFIYNQLPDQACCTSKCAHAYRRSNSTVYQNMLKNKEIIIKNLSEGVPVKVIAKSIGIKQFTGGYYTMFHNFIEEIKKESAQ
jgi:hypothetical protein